MIVGVFVLLFVCELIGDSDLESESGMVDVVKDDADAVRLRRRRVDS